MPNPYLIKIEDIERYMFMAGIHTYAILWRTVDKAAVRWGGREINLAAADIAA